MTTVLYEQKDGVATITLNRPELLNAMSFDLMIDLRAALAEVEKDPSVRVAILTGAGRGFCSGADLSSMGGQVASAAGTGQSPAQGMDDVFHPAMRVLADLPVPTIGRINGVAAGGGMGLAMTCDITIAARSASLVCTFGPRLGVVPDLGTTWHLAQRTSQARALGIAMLGERISAEQAADWGLIWKVVDDDQLDATVDEIAQQLARSSPDAMARIRGAIQGAPLHTLSEQLDVERDHQSVLIPKNMGEGAAAFMEKREPVFDGGRTERQGEAARPGRRRA